MKFDQPQFEHSEDAQEIDSVSSSPQRKGEQVDEIVIPPVLVNDYHRLRCAMNHINPQVREDLTQIITVKLKYTLAPEGATAQGLVEELKRFMIRKAYTKDIKAGVLSPSPLVDFAWQEVVTLPAQYSKICVALAGEVIVHNPLNDNNLNLHTHDMRLNRTFFLYNEFFGKSYPALYWMEDRREKITLRIFVRDLAGKTMTVQIATDTGVRNLKNLISYKKGTPIEQQRLIFAGRELDDGLTLHRCKIRNDSTIHLVCHRLATTDL